jgi:hypothetical protein
MLTMPITLVFAALSVWGIFNPALASWAFLGLGALYGAWMLVMNKTMARRAPEPNSPPLNFDEQDVETFKKYAAYFLHPFVCRQYAAAASGVQMICWGWIAWLLWNKFWIQAGCFAVLLFLMSTVARTLNIGFFLRYHDSKGKLNIALQILKTQVESVEDKFTAYRHARIKKEMDEDGTGKALARHGIDLFGKDA